jgi:hypothetical protein
MRDDILENVEEYEYFEEAQEEEAQAVVEY